MGEVLFLEGRERKKDGKDGGKKDAALVVDMKYI